MDDFEKKGPALHFYLSTIEPKLQLLHFPQTPSLG